MKEKYRERWKECLRRAGEAKKEEEFGEVVERANRAVMVRLREEERKKEFKVSL